MRDSILYTLLGISIELAGILVVVAMVYIFDKATFFVLAVAVGVIFLGYLLGDVIKYERNKRR